MCAISEKHTHTTNKNEIEKKNVQKVDDSGGAHCMSSTVVVNSYICIKRSNRNVRITKKRTRKRPKRNENFITTVRVMMAILMVNYIVYDDDVSYFSDVVDIDHQSLMMNVIVMVMMTSVNMIDFDFDYGSDYDCYLAEIVSDDDDDFCDDDDDDACAISSFSSFFYVSLVMMMK
jgi:hypothetical protein